VAAFGGPVSRTRVSIFYQIGLVLVTGMMIPLPVTYVELVGAAAYGVYLYATHFAFLLQSLGGGIYFFFLKALVFFAPLFSGVILGLFMVKPLFARRARHAQPLAMNPANPIARGEVVSEPAFTVAAIKRALDHLHKCQAGLEAVAPKKLLSEPIIVDTRKRAL